MSEGTKLEEKIRFERMDGSSPPLRFKLSAIDHYATSPKSQDTITCSMSKIEIEPIITMFGIAAACVFQSFYIVVGNESALALIISQQAVDC